MNNPRFAGAYAYGRRRYRRAIDGKRTFQRRDQDDWLACIPKDGRVLRDFYVFRVKSPKASKAPWDYYELIATIPAEDGARSLAESECPLVKKP